MLWLLLAGLAALVVYAVVVFNRLVQDRNLFARLAAMWLAFTPFYVELMFGQFSFVQGALVLTLLAGTPALTFIGVIGAAIAVTLRRGGLLVAVLVLPLTIPVLIFGVAAANAATSGPVPFGTPFTVLCALTLASLVVGPFAAAAALRQEME